jgi:hypothetical protein
MTLRTTRVVVLERVEFAAVDRFGLPEFAALQQRSFGGTTFKNTYFGLCGHLKQKVPFSDALLAAMRTLAHLP